MKTFAYIFRNFLGFIVGTAAFVLTYFVFYYVVSFLASFPFIKSILYMGATDMLINIGCILTTAFFAGLMSAGKISKATENGFSLGAFLYTIVFLLLIFVKNFNLFYYSGATISNIIHAIASAIFVIVGFAESFNGSFDD